MTTTPTGNGETRTSTGSDVPAARKAEMLEAMQAEEHSNDTTTMTCGDDMLAARKAETRTLEATRTADVTTLVMECDCEATGTATSQLES